MNIRRREFVAGLGGAAAWPVAAWGQQGSTAVVGYLDAGVPEAMTNLVSAFRKGLSETGFSEGRNVAIEYRFAQNEFSRLPELVADLVRRRVDVIATPINTLAALAAKEATTTIPIVFGIGADPVQAGLVASFSRPGANLTGINLMNVELGAKRLGLLHELVPGAARFGVLVNPLNPVTSEMNQLQAAATSIRTHIEVVNASTGSEIETAFARLVQNRCEALVVTPDILFQNRRVQLQSLAMYFRVPAIYAGREYAEAGGLMSYGSSLADHFRLVGVYTGRVLKGEKPADLPVMQPTKFEFVINRQTAKLLGLTIPPGLLAIADEVIE